MKEKNSGSEEVEHCFKSSFIIPVKKNSLVFFVKLSHPKVQLGLSC